MNRTAGNFAERERMMIAWLKQWLFWLFDAEEREKEAFFSHATSLEDLDRRIHNWERHFPTSLH